MKYSNILHRLLILLVVGLGCPLYSLGEIAKRGIPRTKIFYLSESVHYIATSRQCCSSVIKW